MTTSNQATADQTGSAIDGERADLLATLELHRNFLRKTTSGLTDEQAALTPTVSELCLGGLIKHVASAERTWLRFILEGPAAHGDYTAMTEEDWTRRANEFRMLPGETLAGVLEDYAEAARRTDEVVAGLPDLNDGHPLPNAPWFTDARWSARRVLLHIIAETCQHAGHADIIRETIDGAKSMG